MIQLTQEQVTLINETLNFRSRALQNDTPELQQQRKKFINFLMREFHSPTKYKIFKNKYGGSIFLVESSSVEFCEMYYKNNSEPIKGKWNYPDIRINRFWNTRKKLPSETICEIDKLPLDDSFKLFCEICLSLMRNKIHFVVFYAQGQRSPHIRIYDFYELEELTPLQRERAQLEFWRRIAPFLKDKFLDKSIFSDEHPVCLEFAPHWKYGTPFDLLFEYIPTTTIVSIAPTPKLQEEKCKP